MSRHEGFSSEGKKEQGNAERVRAISPQEAGRSLSERAQRLVDTLLTKINERVNENVVQTPRGKRAIVTFGEILGGSKMDLTDTVRENIITQLKEAGWTKVGVEPLQSGDSAFVLTWERKVKE